MSNSEKIRREARARNIEALLHFTPAVNLPSILENGLGSRSVLDAHDVSYTYTDDLRADDRPDALSLSVSEINYSMFDTKRRQARISWVILALDPSILWTHSCRFCWANAASREIRSFRSFLGGPWGFSRMFDGAPMSSRDPRCRREVYELANNVTTDNAAEVQVFDPIDSNLIIAAGVQNERDKALLETQARNTGHSFPVDVTKDLFQV